MDEALEKLLNYSFISTETIEIILQYILLANETHDWKDRFKDVKFSYQLL